LIRGNAFFVLDLGLDIVDGIRRLDFKSDGWKVNKNVGRELTLASECLDKDLHV
jgi:hypothetical protein